MNLQPSADIVIRAYQTNDLATPGLIDAAYTVTVQGEIARWQLQNQRDEEQEAREAAEADLEAARDQLTDLQKRLVKLEADLEFIVAGIGVS